MKTLLVINSSPDLKNSNSRLLSDKFVKYWTKKFPTDTIVYRDIGKEPTPHLTQDALPALSIEDDITTGTETRVLSDQLINELKEADTIVLAVPMHNFSIPSCLKAYFDHVARVGKTIKFSDNGIVGMLENKSAIVITTGGGMHQNTERDFQGPYLKHFLGFIGIQDVLFIRAHGLLYGDDVRNSALCQADKDIVEIIDAQSRLVLYENAHQKRDSNLLIKLKLDSECEYLDFSAKLFGPVKLASYIECGFTIPGGKVLKDILDVGCGVGKDTLALADLTTPESKIVGIDANPEVIKIANHRSNLENKLNVAHEVLDSNDLKYRDKFDCARSERLFNTWIIQKELYLQWLQQLNQMEM